MHRISVWIFAIQQTAKANTTVKLLSARVKTLMISMDLFQMIIVELIINPFYFCLDSFEAAKEFRDKRRPQSPPVYNASRYAEMPIPNITVNVSERIENSFELPIGYDDDGVDPLQSNDEISIQSAASNASEPKSFVEQTVGDDDDFNSKCHNKRKPA